MSGLQKNVASQKFRVFAFDITTGAAKTGDAANISAKVSKDWAAAAATNDVAPTETEDGYYLFDLTQAETNADVLDLYPESSTSNIQVIGVPGTIYTEIKQTGDSYDRIGTAGAGLNNINLPDQTMNITGNVSGSVGSVTGAVGSVTAAITLPTIPTNWIAAAGIAASALNGKGDWNVGKAGYALTTANWNVGKTGYSLTVAPLTASEVNAEVDTALSDIHLDHLLAVDYNPAAKPGVGTALLNEMVEDDAGVSRFTVNALENGPSGSGASAAAIADAVWDEVQTGHVTAGTFGKYLDIEVSSVSGGGGLTQQNVRDAMKLAPTGGTPATGSVDEHLDDVLTDTNELQGNQGDWATATGFATDAVCTEARMAELDAANLPTDVAATALAATAFDASTDTVDIGKISGSTTAADNLEASALGIVPGVCEGTPTTTVIPTDLAEATDDHYIGRIVVLTSGAAAGEATDITDYAGAAGTLTVTALTTAPVATNTFVIV